MYDVGNDCDNVKYVHIALWMMLSWEDPESDTVQFMILKDCSGCRVSVRSELQGLRGGRQTRCRLLQPR